jgi:hypothetical protein
VIGDDDIFARRRPEDFRRLAFKLANIDETHMFVSL